ncbi:MAG TPA: 2-octaprenyl-6-methoxyphenyl hydroxylase [Steroidobacteraceae bacterium]|nr:2-octaprenyl-6-methoxyphenyl hydroxylase [Steroidobacteraceae bacterium]
MDVAIAGGGMVGASLAAALSGSGRRVLIVESVPFGALAQPSFDERTTALGNASRRVFEGLGLWDSIEPEAAAIRDIHVSEAGRFGFARLSAREQGIEAFGYVVPNRSIGAALWRRMSTAADLTLQAPAHIEELTAAPDAVRFKVATDSGESIPVRAQLLVAADGAQSQLRAAAGIAAEVVDYGQVAVAATVGTDRAHGGQAFERFTASGPLAVLPRHDGALAVIWACGPQKALELLAMPEEKYLAELQSHFGWRAGRFVRAGVRNSYPLKLTRSKAAVALRTVLIGNAAQTLHPVAGQGFNLGLRDAAMLAEVIAGTPGDAGAAALLSRFAAWRARDRRGVIGFTDGLVRLFGDSRPGAAMLRNLGLLLFDLTPPAKQALARVSAGFGGPAPRLARGLPLHHA